MSLHPTCEACGDCPAESVPEAGGRVLCRECAAEIVSGRIPRVTDSRPGVPGKKDDDMSFDRAIRAIEDGR